MDSKLNWERSDLFGTAYNAYDEEHSWWYRVSFYSGSWRITGTTGLRVHGISTPEEAQQICVQDYGETQTAQC